MKERRSTSCWWRKEKGEGEGELEGMERRGKKGTDLETEDICLEG